MIDVELDVASTVSVVLGAVCWGIAAFLGQKKLRSGGRDSEATGSNVRPSEESADAEGRGKTPEA